MLYFIHSMFNACIKFNVYHQKISVMYTCKEGYKS